MLVASLVGIDLRSTMDIDTTVRALPLNETDARKIIQKIMDIPIETFYTAGDNQSHVSIEVYESRSTDLKMEIEGRSPITTINMTFTRSVAMGLTTAEIANRMSISVDSVKKYLSTFYDKLSISGRNEIKSLLPLYGSGETDKNTSFPSIK